jgi:archaeal flagellin FlaB
MPETGFTGLEAAIVLIAFVVVAAVFSFVVLQMGFLAAQESQSAIRTGVEQAGSSCTVAGTVYGIGSSPSQLTNIIIPVGLTAGGEPIDIASVSVRFTSARHIGTPTQKEPLIGSYPAYNQWSVQEILNGDGDTLLEQGEMFLLNISPLTNIDLVPNGAFAIEIKPAGRAPLRVARTIPAAIDRVTRLG